MRTEINQSGRSMIEMLGVLAIIGVLSVGGIAGYSKAMSKYRTNKTIDQITQIINGVRTLYSGQKNYGGINNTVLRKAKILPESAFEGSGSGATNPYGINPFGGVYFIKETGRKTAGDDKAVMLLVSGVPDEACMELATQDWGAGESLFAVYLHNSWMVQSDQPQPLENCSGSQVGDGYIIGCSRGSTISLPLTVDNAVRNCIGDHSSGYSNSFQFYFY